MSMQYGPFGTSFTMPDIPSEIDTQQAAATAAADAAGAFLTSISDWITGAGSPLEVTDISPTISTYTALNTALTNAPALPTAPDIDDFDTAYGTMPEMVGAPSAINITTWDIGDLEAALGTLPIFSVTRPAINYPTVPQEFTATAPNTDIDIVTDFVFPAAPIIEFPILPDLNDFTIPTLERIILPDFSMALPTAADAPITELSFEFIEAPYSSATLTAVTADLLSRFEDKGTGISPIVEQAIWDRARDREEASAKRLIDKVLTDQVSRGFQRPQGSYFAAMQSAYQEAQNKIAEMNREIFIKQADLEQENLKFAVTSVISLEQLLMNIYNSRVQRQFDTAKYAKELAYNIMNLRLQKVTLEKDIYNVYITGYNARIQGALAEVEKFKAEVEGQRIIAEINKNLIDAYTATVQGLGAIADVYKTEVDAVTSRIQGESIKIQNLQAQIQEYTALINAKRMEYENYANQISAENTKLVGYETDIKAFNTRLTSYATMADVYDKSSNAEIKEEELKLEQYKNELDYTNQYIQQWTAKIQAVVSAYNQNTQLYKTKMDSMAEEHRLELQDLMNQIERDKVAANAAATAAQIMIENAKNSAALILEGYKTGATVQAQIASGAMSSVHLGASVSATASSTNSYDEKNDVT